MRTIKGPAVFLAQFIAPEPPFDRLETLANWADENGYLGVQMPSFDPAVVDLEKAAGSQDYCDKIKGLLAERGLVITELSTHRQGHCVAVHPAYDLTVDDVRTRCRSGQPGGTYRLGAKTAFSCGKGLSRARPGPSCQFS